jgi:hypothetical protein
MSQWSGAEERARLRRMRANSPGTSSAGGLAAPCSLQKHCLACTECCTDNNVTGVNTHKQAGPGLAASSVHFGRGLPRLLCSPFGIPISEPAMCHSRRSRSMELVEHTPQFRDAPRPASPCQKSDGRSSLSLEARGGASKATAGLDSANWLIDPLAVCCPLRTQ